jgi:hypothetical protein
MSHPITEGVAPPVQTVLEGEEAGERIEDASERREISDTSTNDPSLELEADERSDETEEEEVGERQEASTDDGRTTTEYNEPEEENLTDSAANDIIERTMFEPPATLSRDEIPLTRLSVEGRWGATRAELERRGAIFPLAREREMVRQAHLANADLRDTPNDDARRRADEVIVERERERAERAMQGHPISRIIRNVRRRSQDSPIEMNDMLAFYDARDRQREALVPGLFAKTKVFMADCSFLRT